MPPLSVQMCTYNRKEILSRALDALSRQTLPPDQFELVLVDDGSTDGTGEYVRSLRLLFALNFIQQPNSGLAVGRNKGIRAAQGDIVLFIDDDIIAHPNLLKEHLQTHKRHPESVVKGWVNHIGDMDHPGPPKFTMADISTAFFWTSNVSVMRKYLVQAGWFDETFREYGWEDLELGLRLQSLGLVSRFNPRAIVFHYKKQWDAEEVAKLCRQAEAKARTAVMFLAKHPHWRVRLATGIWWLRIWWNDVLALGGWLPGWCRRRVERAGLGNLTGLTLWAAKQVVTFEYFQAVKGALAAQCP